DRFGSVGQGVTQVFGRRLVIAILACEVSLSVLAFGQRSRSSGTNSEMIVHVRAPTGEPLSVPAIVLLFKSDGTPHGRTTAQGIAPVVFSNLGPGHPDIFYLLGVLYVRLDDPTRARSALEKATQLDPNHARALAALGTVLSNQGEYAAAIPVLKKAMELNDHAWETQWTLASAEYHERQFEQARDHAQQALNSAQGKAPEIQLLLAQALGALGQREKAAQQLESFLGSHPEHVKAPLARGWLAKLQQQGR